MNLGDFTPGGRYNQSAGGLAQQPEQPDYSAAAPNTSITNAAPQPDPLSAGPLANIPRGLLETLYLGQQIGFGNAFMQKYGHRFASMDGAEDLGSLLSSVDAPLYEEEESEYIEGEELDDLTFSEAVLGALAQVEDNLIKPGGLNDARTR
jgi:hypothetical protein